jgi:hypothetical protein
MAESYTGIRINVGRQEADGMYPVRAELDDGGVFEGGELRIEMADLLVDILDPKEYGLDLFDALLNGPIRRAYDKVTGQAQAETGGRVRVRLWIDDGAAELHAVPWERLYHIHRGHEVALAASELTPFSRYTWLETGEVEAVTVRPLRLLFAIANPRDLPPHVPQLEVEREVAFVHEALGDLLRVGQVEVTILPGRTGLPQGLVEQLEARGYRIAAGATTLSRIRDHLPGCHILHLLGHGHYERQGRQGEGITHLYLEQPDGAWKAVGDEQIVDGLTRLGQLPQLVFLAACESAKRETGAENAFVGLGPKLVKAGVPAVVAMQDLVPVETARRLTGHFYQGLLKHGVVDRAMNEARGHLFDPERIDWATPVLFMRLRTGELVAPDPVRTTLEAILARFEEERPALAVEVAHLVGKPESIQFDPNSLRGVPAVELVEAVNRLLTEPFQDGAVPPSQGKFILLVGAHGMAKTAQLHHLVARTAKTSLTAGDTEPVIPIFVDLRGYSMERSGSVSPVEAQVLEVLKEYWLGLDTQSLGDLPLREKGLRLRLLFDGTDDLTHGLRSDAWEGIQDLVTRYPQDEYLLAVDADRYLPRLLQKATDTLIVVPLSTRVIERFLKEPKNEPFGSRLYDALDRKQLFDLASIPWLLVGMLEQARHDTYPKSRAVVLENLVEDAIAKIPTEHGMRSRARPTLYALAWAMQSGRKRLLEIREAFEIMGTVRANREYSLEHLVDALVDSDLMVRVGEESVRFYYPAYQDYCAAREIANMTGRDDVLDDIAASLGRLTRLRWWEGTLILLSGLMSNPRVLHRRLLYGASLNEGEEIFLIVRCLLESSDQRIAEDVRNQVVDALIWQLDSANVRQSDRRVRVAHVLGQLREQTAIPYLINVATKEVRVNSQGWLTYDLTSVRMAAAVALERMMPTYEAEIKAVDANLLQLLLLWNEQDVHALEGHLVSGDVVSSAIAAAALADIQSEEAFHALASAVRLRGLHADTSWALTDALALLDPVRVTGEVIVPLIEGSKAHWYERLVYLIGKTRTQDATALAFLDRCLHELWRVNTKANAIQSVGWLQDRTKTRLLEYVAMGRFDEIEEAARQGVRKGDDAEDIALKKGFALGKATAEDRRFLRRKAIEALADIGDADTLTLLREGRVEWDAELRRAFYWTSEEIYWREQVRKQR